MAFFDATLLFDNLDAAVYSDNCCHYNQTGNDLLADVIYRTARAELANR